MARISGAFGIRGWVKLRTYTEDPGGLGDHERWHVRTAEGWRERALEDLEVRPNGVFAKLEGCDDRGAAEALAGADVAVPRAALGDVEEGTYYWVDLVGLAVVDASGAELGAVDSLFQTGEASVLVVKGGAKERLIPFVDDYVKSVDREARRITVDWKPEYDA